ncbi:MAG: hypothetical protein ACYC21_00240 [Eubacteriales bacterium]
MPEQSTPQNENLVELWEQMGTSTGNLIGKIIGLTAQYGLQAYQQAVINPLNEAGIHYTAPPSETGVPSDIRQQTWGQMGKDYGEYIGTSLGMAMDLFIKSVENSVQSMSPGLNNQAPKS